MAAKKALSDAFAELGWRSGISIWLLNQEAVHPLTISPVWTFKVQCLTHIIH